MKTKCEYSGTLFIISRKYFSVFRGPHLPLDTPFWTRCFPLVMQSRKAGFLFAARARMREPCLQRYVSRMTRTENFLSQFFSANNEQGTRIFTLGLHYFCIPSCNNIVKIFSNRPAVAGIIKKKVQLQLD